MDPSACCQTQDIIGKHIYEFKRKDPDSVPEIFILLVAYFEINEFLLKTEGIFRLSGALDKIEELQIHISMGNYYYLTELN